jgi:hypothetical protein
MERRQLVALTAVQAHLKNVIKEADVTIKPGTYKLKESLTFHVTGSAVRFKNTKKTPTNSVPLKTVLAFMLVEFGLSGKRSVDTLMRVMNKALKSEEHTLELGAREKEVDEAEALVVKKLKKLPKTPVQGKFDASKVDFHWGMVYHDAKKSGK